MERKVPMSAKTSAAKEEKILKEQRRLYEMTAFEREYTNAGYKYIGGADEVGRGPLAGPVVACIVILPEGFTYPGINDSKKVSAKLRASLSDVIKENACAYAVAEISEREIDEINILNATKKAMKRAFEILPLKPDFILADAIIIPDIEIPQKSVIGGDAKSITIAAASIVAKVYRDELMKKYALEYPQYGFERNMGYGTR
jgi:ribonuclease HII